MEYLRTLLGRIRAIFSISSHTHPVRDWFLILAVCAVCVGISIGWNVWNYVSTQAVLEQAATAAPVHGFDRSVVNDMEQAFAERKVEAEKYQGTYHFVDPSR